LARVHVFTAKARRSLRGMFFFLSVEKDRKEKTASHNAAGCSGLSDTNAFDSDVCCLNGFAYCFASFSRENNKKNVLCALCVSAVKA
jgi:hypothetical protein